MTATIIPFPNRRVTQRVPIDYWGGCPRDGAHDGYLNDFKNHWFVCHQHRTKWYVGSNLISSWQYETEADWQRNRQTLASYRVVEPLQKDVGYGPDYLTPAEKDELLDQVAEARARADDDFDWTPA